jgi:hypothetical protein
MKEKRFCDALLMLPEKMTAERPRETWAARQWDLVHELKATFDKEPLELVPEQTYLIRYLERGGH